MSAKITSLTLANKISVGENVYKLLHPELQSIPYYEYESQWLGINHQTGSTKFMSRVISLMKFKYLNSSLDDL
jgi:hypothetical protein